MKKILVMGALCLFTAGTLMAQGVGVGIKGGLNFASLDADTDASSRTGIHFGAYAKVMPTDKFGVQAELFYSVQGASDFGNVKATVDANYVNIPILLRISPVPILNLHAGPQFGILLSADQDGTDIKDTLNGSDLSLAVGAGLDLPMGLNLTLRYIKGLSDISDDNTDSIKNNIFQISVGFDLIGLGK